METPFLPSHSLFPGSARGLLRARLTSSRLFGGRKEVDVDVDVDVADVQKTKSDKQKKRTKIKTKMKMKMKT